MSPEEAIYVLEPLWAGLLASQVRVMELAEVAETMKGRAAWHAIGDLQAAADFLRELSRRLDEAALHALWETSHGKRVAFPVAIQEGARRELHRRYLENRPKAAELLKTDRDRAVQVFRLLPEYGKAVVA